MHQSWHRWEKQAGEATDAEMEHSMPTGSWECQWEQSNRDWDRWKERERHKETKEWMKREQELEDKEAGEERSRVRQGLIAVNRFESDRGPYWVLGEIKANTQEATGDPDTGGKRVEWKAVIGGRPKSSRPKTRSRSRPPWTHKDELTAVIAP